MPTQRLTPEMLSAAMDGFEAQKARIDDQIAELRAMLNGRTAESTSTAEVPKRKRRRMSAAGRAHIAAAQRERWAKMKGESSKSSPEAPKPKRKLSAAGRKAIIAASKKRWALKRAVAAKA